MDENKYENAAKMLEEVNPKLFNDPAEMKKVMAEFQKCFDEEADPIAKNIYAQGRNFMATVLGEELIPEPKIEIETEDREEIIEIPEQTVAVKVDGEIYMRAMQKAITAVRPELKIEVYHEYKPLIQDILAGKIAAIIGIGMFEEEVRTEGIIRHDLKYFPGFDFKKAEKFPLPPIAHQYQPVLLKDIVEMAEIIIKGKFVPKEDTEEYDFENTLPLLRAEMLPAKEMTVIALVDDVPHEVDGMIRLLEVWPNLAVFPILGEPENVNELVNKILAINPKIVLLDEAIATVKGTDVANALWEHEYAGIIASTTGGSCPKYTKDHFGRKIKIEEDLNATEQFIQFMNRLIARL